MRTVAQLYQTEGSLCQALRTRAPRMESNVDVSKMMDVLDEGWRVLLKAIRNFNKSKFLPFQVPPPQNPDRSWKRCFVKVCLFYFKRFLILFCQCSECWRLTATANHLKSEPPVWTVNQKRFAAVWRHRSAAAAPTPPPTSRSVCEFSHSGIHLILTPQEGTLAPSGSSFSEEWVCFSLSRVKRPDRWLVSLCDEGAVDLLVWFHVFTQVHENSSVLYRCFN